MRIVSYAQFWPFYVSQHLNRTCRRLHFAGTSIVLAFILAAALVSPWFLAAAPVAGYGFAWAGHFVFEGNRPATFTYPLWSLRGDFKLFGLMAFGKMDAELTRLGLSPQARQAR